MRSEFASSNGQGTIFIIQCREQSPGQRVYRLSKIWLCQSARIFQNLLFSIRCQSSLFNGYLSKVINGNFANAFSMWFITFSKQEIWFTFKKKMKNLHGFVLQLRLWIYILRERLKWHSFSLYNKSHYEEKYEKRIWKLIWRKNNLPCMFLGERYTSVSISNSRKHAL